MRRLYPAPPDWLFFDASHHDTLHDTVFTTIPGSPAYPGKASRYMVNEPKYGFNIDLHDHNAVQGSFAFEV